MLFCFCMPVITLFERKIIFHFALSLGEEFISKLCILRVGGIKWFTILRKGKEDTEKKIKFFYYL